MSSAAEGADVDVAAERKRVGRCRDAAPFHPAVREWFTSVFRTPTRAQAMGWPAIAARRLDADLRPDRQRQNADGVPLGAGPIDVRAASAERARAAASSTSRRSKRWPSTSSATSARRSPESRTCASERGEAFVAAVDRHPHAATRRQRERARFLRDPADILITTPESLYLMLTSNAREMLRGVETIIIDEIHALVPNKRGAHLALSLERLSHDCASKTAAADRPVGDAESAGRGCALSRRLRGGRSRRVRQRGRPGNPETQIAKRIRDHSKPRFRRSHHQHRREKAAHPPRRSAGRGDGEARRVSRDEVPSGPAGQGVRARRSGRRFIRACWS